MPTECQHSTSGGKGNKDMFIERSPSICAAGLPTAQPGQGIPDAFEQYLLKDEVDALIGDAIIPPPKEAPRPPLRYPLPRDARNQGIFTEVAALINPPSESKLMSIVNDLKQTVYKSYWETPLAQSRDPTPMLPAGFDAKGTTFGKKTTYDQRLYDIVLPKDPYPDKTPKSKEPGAQTHRNYCSPPFNSNFVYGQPSKIDNRGIYVKCCLTDDRVILGNASRTILSSAQSNFQDSHQSRIGEVLAPFTNINNVPKGYSFGMLKPPDNLPECLTTCDINPQKDFYRKCVQHLNILKKCMSTRSPTFFRHLYLQLRYFDKKNTGWLPKEEVYKFCITKFIRFDPALLEPLLAMWNAFDGSQIEYKTFIYVLNGKEPCPDLPKIRDIPCECLEYTTSYQDMTRPGQEIDKRRMAGLPSGRYIDLDYPITPDGSIKAIRVCLPQENDMNACINPCILTLTHVSHRDMYAKREPAEVRRVFEASGEKFSDEQFDALWEEAKKYDPQHGWVCYQTFRRVLERADKNNK